jgi:hypothetical protein
MIALKLITQALQRSIGLDLPQSCYHIKSHGGLKKAVQHTHKAISEYKFVMRSDIKGYYDSINFNILFNIIEKYVKNPILIRLIIRSCYRTETRGGLFYEYHTKGIPMGSPLSPLLGAIALMPLDQAISQIPGVFYSRFMDDWVVFTKSKTALRKVIKQTHNILNTLKLQLHPTKTYIGNISHGFNFLGYYMDDQKILPSQETIRRFSERSSVLYEHAPASRRYKRNRTDRDTSHYYVNESAPTEASFSMLCAMQYEKAKHQPDIMARLRKYLGQWANWLKCGLTESPLVRCVFHHLPTLYACWKTKSYDTATDVSFGLSSQ